MRKQAQQDGLHGWSGWRALGAIGLLLLANESLPFFFGSRAQATWDWSLTFVTLRFVVVPLAALAFIGTNVVAAIRARRMGASGSVKCLLAASFVAFCWLLHGVLFGK